jgi:hypothetical protein
MQRNADRKAVNEAVFQLAFGRTDKSLKSFYPSERITFTTNKYFATDKNGNPLNAGNDREFEHINILNPDRDQVINTPTNVLMRDAAMDRAVGLTEERAKARKGEQTRKRKRLQNENDFGMGQSDDVFNGEIRQLKRIVDMSGQNGQKIESVEHTHIKDTARGGKKVVKKRLLDCLDLRGERKILNITSDYDPDDIERAYCLTASKMQGSEDRNVIYIVTPSPYVGYGTVVNTLFNEELYMVTTRTKGRIFLVAGRDEREGLTEIRNIASVHEERPRNVFGKLLKIAPEVRSANAALAPPAGVLPFVIPSSNDDMEIDDVDFDD